MELFIPRFIAIAWIADRSFTEPSCVMRIITTGHKRVISASRRACGTTCSVPRLKIDSPIGRPGANADVDPLASAETRLPESHYFADRDVVFGVGRARSVHKGG